MRHHKLIRALVKQILNLKFTVQCQHERHSVMERRKRLLEIQRAIQEGTQADVRDQLERSR